MHYDIVVIGSSTGGPKALYEIIEEFEDTFPLPIIIVQHIPPSFEISLYEILKEKAKLPIKIVENNGPITKGFYIAKGGYQLEINNKMQSVLSEQQMQPFAPSISFCLQSLLKNGFKPITVIMSGLIVKNDGLEGTKLLSEKKYPVIIQNKESSLIWSMPKLIKDAGYATDEIALADIPKKIKDYAFQK